MEIQNLVVNPKSRPTNPTLNNFHLSAIPAKINAKIFQNISIKFSIDTSGVNHFYLAFYSYLNQIRSKLAGQADLRSVCTLKFTKYFNKF